MLHDLARQFPNLLSTGYRRTSDPTLNYNCLAWALGDNQRWWEPDPFNVLFWPIGVPRSPLLKNYIRACESEGYERCPDGSVEAGFEKIVLYTENDQFRHAARQLPGGKWTSKLGQQDDITHELEGLTNSSYGEPAIFFRRPIPPDRR